MSRFSLSWCNVSIAYDCVSTLDWTHIVLKILIVADDDILCLGVPKQYLASAVMEGNSWRSICAGYRTTWAPLIVALGLLDPRGPMVRSQTVVLGLVELWPFEVRWSARR